ncbi:MAG: hypothetical protein ACQGVC_23000 [Myxococcota bacterium]
MAYLYVRKDGRVEIREAHHTAKGPRSRTLASFRGPLTEDRLDRAQAAAGRPFDREAVRAKARRLGLRVVEARADAPARALLARLRRGDALDPVLAGLLSERLAAVEAAPVPEPLEDVVDWLGASDAERGNALRDVLRLYDTIARSREPVREPPARKFPRFEVAPASKAS